MMVILGNAGNDWFFDKMKQLGISTRRVYNRIDPILQIRFHSVLNLKDKTAKDVLNGMDSLRRNTKKSKNGVKVRFLTKEELPIFDHLWKIHQRLKNFLIERIVSTIID